MAASSQVDWVIKRLEHCLFSEKVAVFEPAVTWQGRALRWIHEQLWNLYDWMIPGNKARAVYQQVQKHGEALYGGDDRRNRLGAPHDWFESIAARVCLANLAHKSSSSWQVLAAKSDRASVAWARGNATSDVMNGLLRTLSYSPLGDWIADAYGVSDMALLNYWVPSSLSGTLDTFKGRSSLWTALFNQPMPKLDEKAFEALFVQRFGETLEVVRKFQQPLTQVDPIWLASALFKVIHAELLNDSSESKLLDPWGECDKKGGCKSLSTYDPYSDMIEALWKKTPLTPIDLETLEQLDHSLRPLALAIYHTFPQECMDMDSLVTVTRLVSTNVAWTRQAKGSDQPELIRQALMAFKGYNLATCESSDIKKLWVYACGGHEPQSPDLNDLPGRLHEVWIIDRLLQGNHQKWANHLCWADLIEMPFLLQELHQSMSGVSLSSVQSSADMLNHWYRLINAYCLSAADCELSREAFYAFATGCKPTFSTNILQGASWIKQVLFDAKESLGGPEVAGQVADRAIEAWFEWVSLGLHAQKARALILNPMSIKLSASDFSSFEIPPVLTQAPYGLDLILPSYAEETQFIFEGATALKVRDVTPLLLIDEVVKLSCSGDQVATLCSYMTQLGSWPLRRLCYVVSQESPGLLSAKSVQGKESKLSEFAGYQFHLYSLADRKNMRLRVEIPKSHAVWQGFIEYDVDEKGHVALVELQLDSK